MGIRSTDVRALRRPGHDFRARLGDRCRRSLHPASRFASADVHKISVDFLSRADRRCRQQRAGRAGRLRSDHSSFPRAVLFRLGHSRIAGRLSRDLLPAAALRRHDSSGDARDSREARGRRARLAHFRPLGARHRPEPARFHHVRRRRGAALLGRHAHPAEPSSLAAAPRAAADRGDLAFFWKHRRRAAFADCARPAAAARCGLPARSDGPQRRDCSADLQRWRLRRSGHSGDHALCTLRIAASLLPKSVAGERELRPRLDLCHSSRAHFIRMAGILQLQVRRLLE